MTPQLEFGVPRGSRFSYSIVSRSEGWRAFSGFRAADRIGPCFISWSFSCGFRVHLCLFQPPRPQKDRSVFVSFAFA